MPFTTDIGLKDLYKFYLADREKKEHKFVDYKTYAKLIKEANSLMREKIVYESESLEMPYRLGQLKIHKFENIYTKENKAAWKVNYKLTKETGSVVYHGAKYGYKWKWFKNGNPIKGKRWYTFKPCRTASRMIADAIINKQLDYFSK